jgi:hypothetical protein
MILYAKNVDRRYKPYIQSPFFFYLKWLKIEEDVYDGYRWRSSKGWSKNHDDLSK